MLAMFFLVTTVSLVVIFGDFTTIVLFLLFFHHFRGKCKSLFTLALSWDTVLLHRSIVGPVVRTEYSRGT